MPDEQPANEPFVPERILRHAWITTEAPALKAALELGYFLSLQTEERQLMSVSLLVAGETASLPAGIVFRPPLPADVRVLRKLAVATDAATTCVALSWDAARGRLEVRGLSARPELPSHPAGYEKLAIVRVTGPGRVSFVTGASEITYDRGQLVTPKQIVPVPGAVLARLVEYATTPTRLGHALRLGGSVLVFVPAAFDEHRARLCAVAAEACAALAPAWLASILDRVEREGRGGGLFLPGIAASEFENMGISSGGWRVEASKKPISSGGWSRGFLDAIGWRIHVGLAKENITVLDGVDQRALPAWVQEVGLARLDAAWDAMLLDAERCARLCATDGAVVLGEQLEPTAFGVKLKARGADKAFQDALQGRGTRHLSMAEAVSALPNAVGFILSEDGGGTYFLKDGERREAGRLPV